MDCRGGHDDLEGSYGDTRKFFVIIFKERTVLFKRKDFHFFEAFLPHASKSSVEVMEGFSLKGRVGWIINKCITLNESLKVVIRLKDDPTLKSVNPFTFRFLPLIAINGNLQAYVRPLVGGIVENEALLPILRASLVQKDVLCGRGVSVILEFLMARCLTAM